MCVSDAEPYSPSKAVVADDEDVPYDPEDMGQFEDEDAPSGPVPEKEAAAKLGKAALGPAVSAQAGAGEGVSAPQAQPAPAGGKPSVNIDSVMEKISASSNPQEISSLMVAALAKAKDSADQQRILATLTSRVEQQKKLKAEKLLLQDEGGQPDSANTASAVSPSGSVTLTAASQSDVKAALAAAPPTSAAAFSSSSSSSSSSVLLTSAAAAGVGVSPDVSSTVGGTESKSKESISRISALTPETENMPLALKALMEELKGNTQMARAVDKRTERDRREWGKKEAAAKELEAEKTEEEPPPAVKDAPPTILSWSKDSESLIPGLGGAEDEKEAGVGAGTESGEAKDKCDVVTSSTDHGQPEKLRVLEAAPVTSSKPELALSDVDLRHQSPARGEGVGKDPALHGSAAAALPAPDRDDRVAAHPSLPLPVPPPSVSAAYPPGGPFVLPGPPCPAPPTRPPLDVSDIDHRRHMHPPPMYPRMGVMPPGYPPRPSLQPPPPGTEVMDDGDVDMRPAAKRAAPPRPLADQPLEKLARGGAGGSSQAAPPLPPLPPQPPPPLPPLPASSSGGDKGRAAELERYGRPGGAHKPPAHEQWRRSQDGGQDSDHRRHHHDPHGRFPPGGHHHPPPGHAHSHSPSPPHRYRHGGQDRDERHRRDHHFHRDRH